MTTIQDHIAELRRYPSCAHVSPQKLAAMLALLLDGQLTDDERQQLQTAYADTQAQQARHYRDDQVRGLAYGPKDREITTTEGDRLYINYVDYNRDGNAAQEWKREHVALTTAVVQHGAQSLQTYLRALETRLAALEANAQ